MRTRNGSCGCGQLRYSVQGDPINTVFCYCTECQAHTGSDKSFGAWFPTSTFSITQGTPTTYTRKGNSGENMNHLFCAKCGVTIAAEVTVADFYSVAVSSLEEHNDFSPAMLIYTASAPEWAVFPAGVAKYEVLPPGMGE